MTTTAGYFYLTEDRTGCAAIVGVDAREGRAQAANLLTRTLDRIIDPITLTELPIDLNGDGYGAIAWDASGELDHLRNTRAGCTPGCVLCAQVEPEATPEDTVDVSVLGCLQAAAKALTVPADPEAAAVWARMAETAGTYGVQPAPERRPDPAPQGSSRRVGPKPEAIDGRYLVVVANGLPGAIERTRHLIDEFAADRVIPILAPSDVGRLDQAFKDDVWSAVEDVLVVQADISMLPEHRQAVVDRLLAVQCPPTALEAQGLISRAEATSLIRAKA
jgi:hypothetical protein